ncbi:hypothetical protein LCGC14_2643850, partial [marine sediment metagenome]
EEEGTKQVLENLGDAAEFYNGVIEPVDGKRSLLGDANYAIDLKTRADLRQRAKTREERGPDYEFVKAGKLLVAMGLYGGDLKVAVADLKRQKEEVAA